MKSKYYTADDFMSSHPQGLPESTKELVEKKIALLYDFDILRHRTVKSAKRRFKAPDAREEAAREMLTRCETEIAMDIRLHDLLCGEYTLDDIIKERWKPKG